MVLAYFGPETTLPLASTLMTVAGVVLMAAKVGISRVPRLLLWPVRRLFPRDRG